MNPSGLHLLLTYECNLACAHCFVWGGPAQRGTMTAALLCSILDQAERLGCVEWIYFEGGEPFLHYGLLLNGIGLARARGFRVGLVTNAFWATGHRAAIDRLKPLAGSVEDLSLSTDLFHDSEPIGQKAKFALAAAQELGMPAELIRIAQPGLGRAAQGQIPPGESAVVFRGRAAEMLAAGVPGAPAESFNRCPHEDLREPERVHIDPLGHVHVCQGISLGSVLEQPMAEIFSQADPDRHPVIGPLLIGGPAELARAHGVAMELEYADACHLCYSTRCRLRERFPGFLAPDQMYGR